MWKISASRFISQSVMMIQGEKKMTKNNSAIKKGAGGISKKLNVMTTTTSYNSSGSSSPLGKPFLCDDIVPVSLYDPPTDKDVEAVRNISHSLSIHLLDYWHHHHSSSFSSTTDNSNDDDDSCERRDCLIPRYNAMQDGDCKETKCESIGKKRGKSSSEEALTSNPQMKQASYSEISQMILSSLDDIDAVQENGDKQWLDPRQNAADAAVAFIEKLWKINNKDTPNHSWNISAILGGDYGSGKTFLACRLMKQSEGSVLVLCPPGSMVS